MTTLALSSILLHTTGPAWCPPQTGLLESPSPQNHRSPPCSSANTTPSPHHHASPHLSSSPLHFHPQQSPMACQSQPQTLSPDPSNGGPMLTAEAKLRWQQSQRTPGPQYSSTPPLSAWQQASSTSHSSHFKLPQPSQGMYQQDTFQENRGEQYTPTYLQERQRVPLPAFTMKQQAACQASHVPRTSPAASPEVLQQQQSASSASSECFDTASRLHSPKPHIPVCPTVQLQHIFTHTCRSPRTRPPVFPDPSLCL